MSEVSLNFEDKCKQCKFYIRAFFNRENQLRVVCNRTIIPIAKCISENFILFEAVIPVLTYDDPQDPFYVLFEQLTEEELRELLTPLKAKMIRHPDVSLLSIYKGREAEYETILLEARSLSNRLLAVVKERQRKQKLKN